MKPDSGIPVVQPTPVRRRLRQVQSWAILTLLGAASVVFAACGDTTPTPSDDSLIWQYDTGTEGELVIVSPTVTGGVVYAGSYEDRVYALDAESGELLWTFEADSDLSPPPPVVGGVVFVEDLDNLYALDAATGKGTVEKRASLFFGERSVRIPGHGNGRRSGGQRSRRVVR